MIRVLLFALIYGWIEQRIYRQGFRTTPPRLFNQFASYHVALLFLFVATAYPDLKYLPLMVLVEDMSFFFFHPDMELNRKSWVNWSLGGFNVLRQWVPVVYLVLAGAYGVLEYFF